MAVRVVVSNTDEAYGATLRATLLAIKGLKIIAEVDEPSLLVQALDRFQCDVLVANLDPEPETMLHVLGDVLEARPTLPVFGVSESTDGQLILSAIRRGVREFLTKPLDGALLGEAFSKVMERNASDRQPGKLITVIGGSGGLGVTTLAVNLAMELQLLECGQVTIVDLDHRFGQVATLLDVDPHYTMADLCQTTEALDPMVVERALVKHRSGLKVLARPAHFAQADDITAAHCVGVLSALMQMNDYVVCDGPMRFDFGAKAVLDLADYNLLVMQLAVPTVRNLHRMLEGMTQVGYSMERFRLVCNRTGSDAGGISIDDVQATLNLPIFGEVVDDPGTVCAAVNIGEPLAATAPKSKVRGAIKALARELHEVDTESTASENGDRKKKSLLAKIFE